MKNGTLTGSYPLKIAILGGIIGFVILVVAFKIAKGRINSKNMYCKIEIEVQQKKVESLAMIDSGNLLKEPISGKPVIVVETEILKDIIPKQIIENTKEIIEGKVDNIPIEYTSKLRVIPFTSLGMTNGMLLGVKADKITIYHDDGKIKNENAIIGLYNKKLSKTDKYTSLIGISLIEGRKVEDEHIRYAKI